MDMPGFISLLNDHGFEDTSSTRKVEAINDAQNDIASREPWPFLEAEIDLTFSGSSGVATNLPADLRAVLQLVNKTTGTVISPSRADDWTKWFITYATDVADPFTFYFVGNQMRLHPRPPASTTARCLYIKTPATLIDTSLESAFAIPARHHRAVAYVALSNLYSMEDDQENAVDFAQKAEARIQNMRSDLWQRQFQEPDFIHIVDYDDFD